MFGQMSPVPQNFKIKERRTIHTQTAYNTFCRMQSELSGRESIRVYLGVFHLQIRYRTLRYGSTRPQYPTEHSGKVRYELDTGTGLFVKFGTTSTPIPDASVTSVRPPKILRVRVNPTERPLETFSIYGMSHPVAGAHATQRAPHSESVVVLPAPLNVLVKLSVHVDLKKQPKATTAAKQARASSTASYDKKRQQTAASSTTSHNSIRFTTAANKQTTTMSSSTTSLQQHFY